MFLHVSFLVEAYLVWLRSSLGQVFTPWSEKMCPRKVTSVEPNNNLFSLSLSPLDVFCPGLRLVLSRVVLCHCPIFPSIVPT